MTTDLKKILSYVPTVIESSSRGEKSFDIFSRLLRERIIFLGTEIDDDVANSIVAQLLLLDSENPEKDIMLYINSPGGVITAGMAIYDTMNLIKADVQKMERISQEARLLCSKDIKTTKELSLYMNTLQKEISSLEEKRDKLYYQNTKLKKEEKQENYNELSIIAGKIQYLKKEVKMCREIEERVPKIKENIKELNEEKEKRKGKEDKDYEYSRR